MRSLSSAASALAIVEVDRDEDRSRHIVLVDVELLEQRGENGACVRSWRAGDRGIPGLRSQTGGPIFVPGLNRLVRAQWFPHLRQFFPEEFAAVDDFAVAHVKQIHGQAAIFIVVAEDIGIVVLLGRCDALLFLELVHGGELVAQPRRGLKLLGLGRSRHARGQRSFQLCVSAL